MSKNSKLSQFHSNASALDEKYSNRPMFHEKFKWSSTNGKVCNIKEIDDMHLINIFKMLSRSIDCLNECIKIDNEILIKCPCIDKNEINDDLSYLDYLILHIGYEIYVRGLFVSNFEISNPVKDDKTKV